MKAISQALEGDVNPNEMCKLSLVGGDDRQKNEPVSPFSFSFPFCPFFILFFLLTDALSSNKKRRKPWIFSLRGWSVKFSHKASLSKKNSELSTLPVESIYPSPFPKLFLPNSLSPSLTSLRGSPEIAELLLKHKADPNLQSLPYEYTPLHYAAQNNHIAVMNVYVISILPFFLSLRPLIIYFDF